MQKGYVKLISDLKDSILQSRYKAASLANREMLLLYYRVGLKLSDKVNQERWGSSIIQNISKDLQNELPGLRGFSYRNLKKMQQFAEEYPILPLATAEIDKEANAERITHHTSSGLQTDKLKKLIVSEFKSMENFIEDIFLKIGFTHHLLLINKCKNITERLFYFTKIIENQWSVVLLEHHIENNLYKQKGKLINNFDKTLPKEIQKHANDTFKGEYLLDFINIDEDDDERILEKEIVKNIRKFIMSIGTEKLFKIYPSVFLCGNMKPNFVKFHLNGTTIRIKFASLCFNLHS
jgi:predicted nuclease of restriction endonuclease-like (RecB) superfamily